MPTVRLTQKKLAKPVSIMAWLRTFLKIGVTENDQN
jgi:hypothetical protein